MLSIIIPTLNEEKYLPRLLDSIKGQLGSNYEIIVSDAGSSDKTEAVAKEYQVKFVINSEVKHPSYQRNKGAELARGDKLLFLDADTVLPAKFISSALDIFQQKNLQGASFYIKFNPNRWHYNIYSTVSNLVSYLKHKSKNPVAMGAALLVDKAYHDLINGFDLSVVLSEDCDYARRLARVGKFRMIANGGILYSSRRLERDGFFRAGWRWLVMGIFTVLNRPMKKKIIKYDFGKFD